MRILAAGLVLAATLGVRAADGAGAIPGLDAGRRLQPFDYRGVTLTGGSMQRQMLEVREEYLRVPTDDYLKGFRQRAGLPAPGVELGGWYSAGIFHVFGQILSGLARMHAATGDPACREKLDALIEGWSHCIEQDAYFFSTRPPRPAHYIYEKVLCGLLDAHLYAGHPDARRLLDRITTWAERNLDHSNRYVVNTLTGISEWYTLPENLYRAARVTGDPRYLNYARTWEYTNYWNLFLTPVQNLFATSPAYHAYSHVNTLNGAAEAFGATGERRYLDMIRNAYDYLQDHQVYATGGYGPGERLVPAPLLLDYLDVMENHWETQCGSWAAFKLARHLLTFTGEARYGDWIERLVLNGIGASLPMGSDGRVMYYAGHGPGGASKSHNMPPWACCAGTRIQAVADYQNLVFFHDDQALHVNLFTPARVEWNRGGQVIRVTQETRFPENDETRFTLSLTGSVAFAINLRRPAWLAGPPTIEVNGETLAPETTPAGWITLRRAWRDGDRVRVRLPMRLAAERFPRASTDAFPAALVRGPVVLAARSPDGNPVAAIDFSRLESSLVPVPGEPLSYRLAGASNVLFRPYHRFREGERYFLYFDPRHPWTRRPHSQLRYSDGWSLNLTEDLHTTTNAGAFVEHTFHGRRIRWIGRTADDAGRCEIQVDGRPAGVVDQFHATRDLPFRYEISDLSDGPHTIRITLTADRPPGSKGIAANVGGFDVIAPPAGRGTAGAKTTPGIHPTP